MHLEKAKTMLGKEDRTVPRSPKTTYAGGACAPRRYRNSQLCSRNRNSIQTELLLSGFVNNSSRPAGRVLCPREPLSQASSETVRVICGERVARKIARVTELRSPFHVG